MSWKAYPDARSDTEKAAAGAAGKESSVEKPFFVRERVLDPEKGADGLKKTVVAAEEEAAVVDAYKALFIKRALDVFFVVYLLFCVCMVAAMVMVSDNWWDPWPAVLIISPICIVTLWLTPMMKDVYIALYAMKKTSQSDSDLSIKLLASEK